MGSGASERAHCQICERFTKDATTGYDYVSDIARRVTRLIRGQPEGYIEAFANIYTEAVRAIEAEISGQRIPESCDFPRVDDGVAGMAFVDAAVESVKSGGVWTKMKNIQ